MRINRLEETTIPLFKNMLNNGFGNAFLDYVVVGCLVYIY